MFKFVKFEKKKMTRILTILSLLLFITSISCNSLRKVPKGEIAITIPCSGNKYLPDNDFYRSSGDGTAASVSNAESIAMANALQNFTIEFESVVSTVIENYFKATQVDFDINNQNRFEQLGRIVASNTVKNAKRICAQATRITQVGPQQGLYKYYLSYEFSHDGFIESLKASVSEEDQEIDFERFKEVYTKEIEKKI